MINNKEMKPAQAPARARVPPQAPSKIPPKPHAQAPTKGPQVSDHETKHPQLNATAKVSGQLYGVFQLSDHLACDSGMMPSLNVCNMSCSALIDDDISNDIACLKTLMNTMKPKPKEKPTDGNKILEALMVKECRSVVPSKYFADCV
ncbi:lysozyme C, milk isozyme-like isoform X2 [Ctenopharyngodon idella]|uniref:lysozyme C, milk isozyme-like isoform X2 n=1 Tax=Ctenopharyngodon idella TaxID=7959 RepID=UPI002231301B|nr:lysozyme C, milk isozyme-like isoform X2 [Ctenopharyngodon idella]